MKPIAAPKSRPIIPPGFLSLSFVLWFAAGLSYLTPADASEPKDPFETITLGAQFMTSVGRTEFNEYWDPTNGVQVVANTPFYLGAVQVGAHFFQNDGVKTEVVGFRSVYLYLGWGYEWGLPLDVGWFTGIQAGGFYMDFDDDDVPDEGKTESELGFGFETTLCYPTDKEVSVFVSADFRRIMTYRRIDYVFFGAGVNYTWTTPRWLREFLE